MSDILEYKTATDFEKHILWQYNNAPALNSLMQSKQDWYNVNHNNFWNDYINNVLKISTANDYGLSIWGSILQIPRTFLVNGVETTVDTEQYRMLIQARMLLLRTRATLPEINEFLKFVFGKYGKAYVIDNNDMTITYRFSFTLTPLQISILQTIPLLPKPAGVKYIIVQTGGDVFGFNTVNDTVETYADLLAYDTTGLADGFVVEVYQYNDPDTDTATYYKWDADGSQWVQITDFANFFKPFDQAPFASYLR